MAVDTRQKDKEWFVADPNTGSVPSWEREQLAVLMDIRDELKRLNGLLRGRLLHCSNFIGIPSALNAIRRNTTRPRKSKKP